MKKSSLKVLKNNHFIRLSIAVIAIFISISHTACSTKRIAARVMGNIAQHGMIAIESETDTLFARQALPALIKNIEVIHQGNPKNKSSLLILSKAYGQYAFGFLEMDLLALSKDDQYIEQQIQLRQRIATMYARGKDYGMALLHQQSNQSFQRIKINDLRRALKKMNKKHVDALFWTAFNWAGWINMNLQHPKAILDAFKVEWMLDRIIELAPDYYHASAYTLKAVMAAAKPSILGGQPQKAKQLFDKAFALAPTYAMHRTLYAQYYCTRIQNMTLFTSTLASLPPNNATIPKNEHLANALAKARSRILLNNHQLLFNGDHS